MNPTTKTATTCVKLILALAVLFSFSSNRVLAQAHSDKPLEAKSLAALVQELKEVVSSSTPDPKDASAIAEKWDARNLAHKTKQEVIHLLFEDVKSVVKDSGLQYQIYSIFSFYKHMPDESLAFETQATNRLLSKRAAVRKLVDLTFRMHPYVGIDEQLASLPGHKDVRAEEERVRKVRIEVFDEALNLNNELRPEQKAFVKAKYDRLSQDVDKIIDETVR